MVITSSTYDPYADVRYCDIMAVFEMLDVDAEYTATAAVSDECALSKLNQTHDRVEDMSSKLAALERDYFILDGTFILPEPENLGQTGWWSNAISDADGSFSTSPQLTFTWQENHSSVGFTVCFDDKSEEYPASFNVYAYDYTESLINSVTVANTGIRCFVDMPVENYQKIVFEFTETAKPYRRVRVSEVLFGAVQRFDRDNTISASLDTAFSPTSESLPMTEFILDIDNSYKIWNMANPTGIYAYLQKSQPIKFWFGINSEWVFMGQYFFTSATAEDNALTAKITAHDKIYSLDSVKYIGTPSATWTLSQAVEAVLTFSGVGLDYEIQADIGSRLVSGILPNDISCRDAIRMLAQAARCTCFINRNGILTFFDPLTVKTVTDTLNFDNMSDMPKITVGEKVNTLQLIVRTSGEEMIYTASDVAVDEPICIAVYENPLVLDEYGDITAEWLLNLKELRFTYKISERGNPARDVSDWAAVYDPYGGIQTTMITRRKFYFDGGLKCETEALGMETDG